MCRWRQTQLCINEGGPYCCELTTVDPTMDPTADPTTQPTKEPTSYPTLVPTKDPTLYPTTDPTNDPTRDPTGDPTTHPTNDPTHDPTADPTIDPTNDPTVDPTVDPTTDPTSHPTNDPTSDPTIDPTEYPTSNPTADPSSDPTIDPTSNPTANPTMDPTGDPTIYPTADPTMDPTSDPTSNPSNIPSKNPTIEPSNNPSQPPSQSPTESPSTEPSITPSDLPSKAPSISPSNNPTYLPSTAPTLQPTSEPTIEPSQNPTTKPSKSPSPAPTIGICRNATYEGNMRKSVLNDIDQILIGGQSLVSDNCKFLLTMKNNGNLILQQVFPSVIFGWSTNTTVYNFSVKPSTPALILSDGHMIVNEYRVFGASSIPHIELWRSPDNDIYLDESELKELYLILTDDGCLYLRIYNSLPADDALWSMCPSYGITTTMTTSTSINTTLTEEIITEKMVSTKTASEASIPWWVWFIMIVFLLLSFAVFYTCRRKHIDNTQWTTATCPPPIDCDGGANDKDQYDHGEDTEDVFEEDAEIKQWAQNIDRHDDADEAPKVHSFELRPQFCRPGMAEYSESLYGENPFNSGTAVTP